MFDICFVYETVCTDMSCNLRGKIKQSWMTQTLEKQTSYILRVTDSLVLVYVNIVFIW